MCPAAGLNPLRVGPEDVEVNEAGDMVEKLGIGNQAKGLIAAVAKQMPKELRIAAQRYEHIERSEYLDEVEVQKQTEDTVGEDNVSAILSARVRGNKTRPLDSQVVVLFETPEGRTARCAIDYAKLFPISIRAFDRALKAGEVEVGGDHESTAALRRQVERLKAELQTAPAPEAAPAPDAAKDEEVERLQAELDEAKATPANGDAPAEEPEVDLSEVELPQGNAETIEAGLAFYSDDVIAALAEYAKAKSTREAAAAVKAERAAPADEG